MKIKTSELTGRALAYAAGVAEGCVVETWHTKSVAIRSSGVPRSVPWNPHSDWAQGGPIIEREFIQIGAWRNDAPEHRWQADQHNDDGDWILFGPTPLIAAMRCFVASKLGDEIDIPEELLS